MGGAPGWGGRGERGDVREMDEASAGKVGLYAGYGWSHGGFSLFPMSVTYFVTAVRATLVLSESVDAFLQDGHVRVGKLNLVDLAGSERQSKTGATGALI